MIELETPHGPARAHVNEAEAPVATLVLGHGAGGGVGAPDLKAATEAALAVNVTTILVEQPYRVAGRKSAAPAADERESAQLVGPQVRDHREPRGVELPGRRG